MTENLVLKTSFDRKQFIRRLPANVLERDIVHFQENLVYDCPVLLIYQFDSVNILPDGTLFKWLTPLNLSFLYFRGRLRHHNWKGIFYIRANWKRKKLIASKPYVVIHDAWTKNYYHWVTQALPRLLLVQQLNRPFTLLLPDDHQSGFHIESLRLLKIESWQVVECKEVFYDVSNLWYSSHDIQIGDYNDDLIILLRDSLRKRHTTPTKKIFIRRVAMKARIILNEENVIAVFKTFGFEIVEFENLSFGAQISLVEQASVLAGVHGAGLTNMIFMPDHSSIFELTTKVNGENYYYYTLSNALGHNYYYQLCNSDVESVVQEANLIVDVQELINNLSLIIGE